MNTDNMGWPIRLRDDGERVCARPNCFKGGIDGASTEFRIRGFCSIECRDDFEFEEEIEALRTDLRRAVLQIPRDAILQLSKYGLDAMRDTPSAAQSAAGADRSAT